MYTTMRPPSGYRVAAPVKHRRPRWPLLAVTIVLTGLILISVFGLKTGHAAATGDPLKAGVSGYCLDDYRSRLAAGNPVVSWPCNGSAAQDWSYQAAVLRHADGWCLTAQTASRQVTLEKCTGSAGQVWLVDRGGLLNPDSGLCLSAPSAGDGRTSLASCDRLDRPAEHWTGLNQPACSGSEGQKVACVAERQWAAWQAKGSDHNALLTAYTDGAPYEEWCADFVSYVYKTAGYPFTQGEANGWDESNANNIQNMGFTYHAASNYTPKPGDVAYFDYNGGHVEIVISGGPKPTFIYGNSATVDPTTGNGQMATNTITKDGSEGRLIYYLSPD